MDHVCSICVRTFQVCTRAPILWVLWVHLHPQFFCPAPKLYIYVYHFYCPAPKLYIYVHPRYLVQFDASAYQLRKITARKFFENMTKFLRHLTYILYIAYSIYFFSGGRKRHNTVKFVLDEEKWEITKKLRRIILGGGILQ